MAAGSSGNTFSQLSTSTPYASVCAFGGVTCDANNVPVVGCTDAYAASGQFTTPATTYTSTPPSTTSTTLAPTCSDGIQDGNETDVDCGGGVCVKCTINRRCRGNSDCQSDNCSYGYCAGAGTTNTPPPTTTALSTTSAPTTTTPTTTTTTSTPTPAPVNRCLSYPCQNGGTCTYNFFNFPMCLCMSGFYGLQCQYTLSAPSPLFPSPSGALVCQHGSTMSTSSNLCDCSSAAGNFTGNDCSIAYTRLGFALNTTISNVAAASGFDQTVDNALNSAISKFGAQPVSAALVSTWGIWTSFESVASDSTSGYVWVNVDIVQVDGTDWNTTNAAVALLNPKNPPVTMTVNGVLCELQRATLESNVQTPASSGGSSSNGSSFSSMAIIGVAVGCAAGVIIVGLVFAFLLFRRRRKNAAGFSQQRSSINQTGVAMETTPPNTASLQPKEDTRRFPWRKGIVPTDISQSTRV